MSLSLSAHTGSVFIFIAGKINFRITSFLLVFIIIIIKEGPNNHNGCNFIKTHIACKQTLVNNIMLAF